MHNHKKICRSTTITGYAQIRLNATQMTLDLCEKPPSIVKEKNHGTISESNPLISIKDYNIFRIFTQNSGTIQTENQHLCGYKKDLTNM